MERMLINLEESDKAWLAREASAEGIPMTQVVRDALHDYMRRKSAQDKRQEFLRLHALTKGTWKDSRNPMEYQQDIRSEWDDRP